MNLNSLNIKDLKVLAYDRIAVIDTANSELQAINNIIRQKSMNPETPVVTPEETPVETVPEATPETTSEEVVA